MLFFLPYFLLANAEPYAFAGKHFLASYLECDATALNDLDGLCQAMDDAVEASGATILNRSVHAFSPCGATILYTLSESHASIHTYPEMNACFVDLFTCGDHCSSRPFDQEFRKYLQPKTVNARQFLRHTSIEETPYPE